MDYRALMLDILHNLSALEIESIIIIHHRINPSFTPEKQFIVLLAASNLCMGRCQAPHI